MDAIELRNQLAEAEVHFSRYEWDDGIACLDAVLQSDPQNRAAQHAKGQTQAKKAVDEQIQADIGNAQTALEAGSYVKALNILDQAQARGADSAILKYHAEIDRLREVAQERQGWQMRAKEALDEAARFQEQKAVPEALRVLNALLRDLSGATLEDMGQDVRALRDQLQTTRNLDDQKSDVNRARAEEDYRAAYELVRALREQFPNDADIQRLYNSVYRDWRAIQIKLADAEQAVADGLMDDAAIHLGELRSEFPNNPDWKNLWLRAHIDHGRALADAGRQLMLSHAFDDACIAFETAQASFQSALDLFPDHPSVGPARDEVRALQQVAAQASQAERSIRQGNWEPARGALAVARQKLAEAVQVRRRGFSEVTAVLGAMWGQVNNAVEAIHSARAALTDGEGFLTNLELGKAEERFSKGLELAEGRDDVLKETLVERLGRVRFARGNVEKQIAAAESAEGAQRIEQLEKAYAGWPTAPGLLKNLADALLSAAQRLTKGEKDASAEETAARYCERVLNLPDAPPVNREKAQDILDALQAAAQIKAALGEADRATRNLENQAGPTAAGYQAIVDILLRVRAAVWYVPEFSEPVETRRAIAQARQEQLAAAEPLLDRAEQAQKAGQWGEAAAVLAEAAKTLEGVPVSDLAKRLPRWQNIAAEVEQGLKVAEEAYQEANNQYLLGHDDLAVVKWEALNRGLEVARRTLAAKPAGADPLPPAWQELAARVDDLQERANVLRKAWDLDQDGKTRGALPELEEAVKVRPEDPVLRSVLVRLQAKLAEEREKEAARWLAEAREEASHGDLTASLEKLSRAKEQNASTIVVGELRRVERQVTLWQRFREQELDGTAKRNNAQPAQAQEAFVAALRLVLDADSGLTDEVRDAIGRLLNLGNRLHQEDADREAREIQYELQQAAQQNRLIDQFLMGTVTRWYDLASRQAREGFVVSRLELNKLEEGYRAAVEYVNFYPQDSRAFELAAAARERLLASVLEFARKRLGRAEELCKLGIYFQAKNALDEIETDLFGPVEKQFPEIVTDDENVEEVRRQIGNLDLQLQALQEAEGRLGPLAKRIREAFVENRIADARQAIAEARVVDPERRVTLLWQDISALQNSINEREQEQMRAEAQAALDRAGVALRLSQTVEAARQVIADLEAARALFNQLTGSKGELLRQRWTEIAGYAQIHWEDLQAVIYALKTAEEATSQEQRLSALERAVAAARGSVREQVLAQIDELRHDIQEKQLLAEAWNAALAALETGDYDETARRLAEAKQRGKPEAEVAPYLQIARSGQQVRQAQVLARDDPVAAQQSLELVLAQIKDLAPADELRHQVEALKLELVRKITKTEAERQQAQADRVLLAKLLRDGESAYRQGQLDVAQEKLDEIFAHDPENVKASELQARVDQANRALMLLNQARASREAGQYERALGLVNQALQLLSDLSEAQLLQAELLVELEAAKHIGQARDLAKENRYSEAYAELKLARQKNANQPGLDDAYRQVGQQEGVYLEMTLRSVEALQRRQEYRAALERYDQILSHVHPDLQVEVRLKQQAAIDQWADIVHTQAQAVIDEGKSPDDLLTMRDLLREVVALDPPPADRRAQQLKDLIKQVDEERLRVRLREGEEQFGASNYNGALGISEEVAAEAATLRLPGVLREADALSARADESKRRDAIQRAEAEKERQRVEAAAKAQAAKAAHIHHMMEARQFFEKAQSGADLELAMRQAQQALKVEGFADDPETRRFISEVDREIARFDRTRVALEQAQTRLFARAYRRVFDIFGQLEVPSRLLQDEVMRLLDLAHQLQLATDLESDDPEQALMIYQTAIQEHPTLRTSLDRAMNACRAGLFDRALGQVDALLTAENPDSVMISLLLQQAESNGWVTAGNMRAFQDRKARANWLVLTAGVVRFLETGDYEAAWKHLAEASRLGISESELAPYQRVTEAGVLLQRALDVQEQDIVEARDLLKKAVSLAADSALGRKLYEEASHLLAVIERDVTTLPFVEAQRFLRRTKLAVQSLDDQSLLCTSDQPVWSGISPLLVRLLLDKRVGIDESQILRDQARDVFGGSIRDHVAVVVVDHQPAPDELQQIMSLRTQAGLTVVPVTRSDLQAGERIQDPDEWLGFQIGLFAGKVDLLKITEPVADALSFFGREQILAELRQQLTAGHPAIVFGVRKIGKSSLLKRLYAESAWPTASVDLEAHPTSLPVAFLEATEAWQRAIGFRRQELSFSRDRSRGLSPQNFRQSLIGLLETLEGNPGRPGLVLLLDEAEYLFQAPDGLEFARVLRSLKSEPRFSQRFSLLVACKSPSVINRTSIIAGQDNPFYGFLAEYPLGCLDSAATRNMIISINTFAKLN